LPAIGILGHDEMWVACLVSPRGYQLVYTTTSDQNGKRVWRIFGKVILSRAAYSKGRYRYGVTIGFCQLNAAV